MYDVFLEEKNKVFSGICCCHLVFDPGDLGVGVGGGGVWVGGMAGWGAVSA